MGFMKNYLSPSHFFRCSFLLVPTYYLLIFVILLTKSTIFPPFCILRFPMHCSDFYKSYKLCSCSHHSSLYSRFSRVKNSKKIFTKSTRIQRQDFPNFQRNKKNSIKSKKNNKFKSLITVFCYFLGNFGDARIPKNYSFSFFFCLFVLQKFTLTFHHRSSSLRFRFFWKLEKQRQKKKKKKKKKKKS